MKNIQETIIDRLTPEIIADMETIHFTADLHHGHDAIVEICGRLCSKEYHEKWIVESFNSCVLKKHTVYLIGDISFAHRPDANRFIGRLNGNKFLILGNHDKSLEHSTQFTQITQIKDFTYSRFGLNIHIVLCHYPLASWNRKIHGSWHLYGHVHGRFENTGLSYDVGIDNADNKYNISCHGRPINLYEVCILMNNIQKSGRENGYEINT